MKNNEERMNSIMKKVALYKKKRGQIISTVTIGVCAAILAVVGANVDNLKKPYVGNITDTVITTVSPTSKEDELISFASKDELINLFEERAKEYENQRKYYTRNDGIVYDDIAVAESASETNDMASKSVQAEQPAPSADESADYSKTNVQTKGVDESDIIKTDGKKIYYMNNQRKDVKIFEDKDNQISLVKTVTFSNDEENYSYGDSMFLDDKHLIVVAHGQRKINDETTQIQKNGLDIMEKKIAYTPYRYKSFTQIFVYDVNTYELIRKVETEGNLVSSRKVGDNLYLVSNKYVYYYNFYRDDVMPLYKDSLVSDDYSEVSVSNIKGFKDFNKQENCNYLVITALNLSNNNNKPNIDVYLGAGSEIYCSTKNLYVTRTNYENRYSIYNALVDVIKVEEDEDEISSSTSIHKFAIEDGKTTYVATGKVNGNLLNQFSMDEYNNNFRITTTDEKGNNLYVLDEKLNQIGSLENLAKGERIYSTRFMGDKAYVVTYKTVDPLFVIDLKNPSAPKVLGELKIPGYSSYLHPLGENYLLGFGEDSVEKSYINWEGKQEVVAYANGLKMAIFDVSDYSNPKELYSVKIGARGSSSELLYNHKALLLDEAKKIFAFPVRITKEAGYYEDGTPMYGDEEFRGALVYNMDVENGFELRGKITHDEKNYYSIERIIYIGDRFYTVSNGMIKATDMNTMKEVSNLKFN